MAKYKDELLYADPNTTRDMIYCWNRGFYYYPVIIPVYKFERLKKAPKVSKVRIEWRAGRDSGQGDVIYNQNQELYDVIYRLYIHKAKQLRSKQV